MTDGRLVLLVSGPVPGSEGSAGEAAAGLLWELRHVAGIPVSAVLAPAPPPAPAVPPPAASAPSPRPAPQAPGGAAKGGLSGSIVELAVTGLFSTATVAAIARVVVAFVQRGAARQIVLRDGRRVLSITDPSAATEQAVRQWLAAEDSGRTDAGSGAG